MRVHAVLQVGDAPENSTHRHLQGAVLFRPGSQVSIVCRQDLRRSQSDLLTSEGTHESKDSSSAVETDAVNASNGEQSVQKESPNPGPGVGVRQRSQRQATNHSVSDGNRRNLSIMKRSRGGTQSRSRRG